MKYFNISWHSTKDGPGVRTVLFLQGCNLRCEWCHSPHSHPSKSPLLFFQDYCKECGKCIQTCLAGCHSFTNGHHQFQRDRCISCGDCVSWCWNGALKMQSFELSAEEVFLKLKQELHVLKDIGGLTISGGEPLLQTEEVKALLILCKEHGIHTAVETSACVSNESFQAIESETDCWLFGLKQTSPDLCRQMTGADFETIQKNFYFLGERNPEKVIVRTPLIHPVTSDIHNIKTICRMMAETGVKKIELLKYNPYTSLYYHAMGIPFQEQSYRAASDQELQEILGIFRMNDISCRYLT